MSDTRTVSEHGDNLRDEDAEKLRLLNEWLEDRAATAEAKTALTVAQDAYNRAKTAEAASGWALENYGRTP